MHGTDTTYGDEDKRKAGLLLNPALQVSKSLMSEKSIYFLNFLLSPTTPKRPRPKGNMVAR
jgi:hypothetical protein